MTKAHIPPSPGLSENVSSPNASDAPLPIQLKSGAAKQLFDALWAFKLRLQFTGWLQYIPPTLAALVLLALTAAAFALGQQGLAALLGLPGVLLFATAIYDLITVKFRVRPPEARPTRRDALDIFDLMRTRRSCRSFQTRSLELADRNELLTYVQRRSTASSIGPAPVRFEYIAAPLTVWPVVNASEFLVAIAPKKYDRLAVLDIGRTLQKIVMDATRMGLGTCWIGPGADHTSIIRDLGERFDPAQDHIICVCAIGYPSRYIPLFLRIFNRQFKRRRPLSELFFADPALEKPLPVNAPPFDQFGRNYEICQWAPSSYNGQTTRCMGTTLPAGTDPANPGDTSAARLRFDFYAAAGSRYYAPVAAGIWLANWELGCEALGIRGDTAVCPPSLREAGENPDFRCDVSWVGEAAVE